MGNRAARKTKRAILRDPIFDFEFCLQIGGTEESALKWYCARHKVPPPPLDGANSGCFASNDSVKYSGMIWIGDDRGSTIAHEVAHAVAHVCRVLDLDPRHADEFQASYTGYLSRHVTNLHYRKR